MTTTQFRILADLSAAGGPAEASGAELQYSPQYSQDLNPIES
jgi:hypothetical protein